MNKEILSGVFLATGIALGGFFISKTMFNAKVALNTAEAKGLAERRVKADRANWEIGFGVSGKTREEVPQLYREAEAQQARIVALLRKNGIGEREMKTGVIDYQHQEYRDENQNLVDETHSLTGSISVETDKVALVDSVRGKVNKLIAEGINIQNGQPSFHFTRLNDIKPEMLKEATKNARVAANEFAENAGVKVGGINSARQGNFYIRDVGSDYGDVEKIEKDVRVVTTITFYLTD
ncbi:MAG: SIMPL domain-containing protein [Deltaproteobacteria bacterium]|nr:SIMPL domain-containing protein [Deltaproteobacteria bacterium]